MEVFEFEYIYFLNIKEKGWNFGFKVIINIGRSDQRNWLG